MNVENEPELPIDTDDEDDILTVSLNLREYLVEKISKSVVPNPDITARYDWRMLELQEYCKYLERKTFERCEKRTEYYRDIAYIIYRIRRKVETRPPANQDDPYSIIPPPHEMADFMGLTQEELEEFDSEQNPQWAPAEDEALAMETVTPELRNQVIDRLCRTLFPPPDAYAIADGRMRRILRRLAGIEAEAFRSADDRDDYYQRASLMAYRLQRAMFRNGEQYCEASVYYPALDKMGDDLPVVLPEL